MLGVEKKSLYLLPKHTKMNQHADGFSTADILVGVEVENKLHPGNPREN
jgi:hypothetical protein